MRTINKRLIACAVTAALTVPMTAMATNGYFAHGYGMKSKGMAGAGVSTSQSTMSAATNPASLVGAGNRVDFGVDLFTPNRTATTRNDSATYTGDGDSSFVIPEFGYSSKISDTKSWGIIVYGNGGMNTRYSAIAQYAGASSATSTGVNLEQLFIAPTYAMKINDKHTFGVSLNLIRQTFEAYGLAGFCGFKATPCGDGGASAASASGLSDQGEDDSTGFSIKLGWQGKITDSVDMGFAYQTKSDMSKFSKYNQLFAEQGGFDIPSNWTLGVTVKATPKMRVMFDVQQINYTDVASIANANNGTMGGLGTNNGRGFGWDDMTIYKLGIDYKLNNDLVLRAGYSQGDSPIGPEDTAFNLIAPAVIENHITLGATWTLANKSELTVMYMQALENEVVGNTVGAGTNGNANIKMDQNSIGIAYSWKL